MMWQTCLLFILQFLDPNALQHERPCAFTKQIKKRGSFRSGISCECYHHITIFKSKSIVRQNHTQLTQVSSGLVNHFFTPITLKLNMHRRGFQWNFFQANSLQLEIILVELSQSKAVKTQQTRNCTVYRLPGLSTFHLDILHKQCLSAVRFPSSLSAIRNGERQLCYAAMLLEVTVQAEDFNIALSLRLAHHLSLPRRCSEGWLMLRRSE